MTNGARIQFFTTIAASVFAAGALWAKISHNADEMRHTMEKILEEQQAVRHLLETLLNK